MRRERSPKMKQHRLAVFSKDVRSELRTRHSLYAVLLFIVNSVLLILFATAGNRLSAEVFSGILWMVLLFSGSVGMAKSFVSEEERGTSLYLRLVSSSDQVFVGKLLYNVVLSWIMCACSCVLFVVVFEISSVQNLLAFCASMFLGTLGLSIAMTLSSALISRAQAKGALLPVLSFPLVLPVLFVGSDATVMGVVGTPLSYVLPDLAIMACYVVVIFIVALWLFPFVWNE